MTTATTRHLTAAALIGLVGMTGSALAAPTCPETLDPQADYRCVFINRGASAFGDGITGGFYELGLTGTLATSIYQAGLAVGSTVIDTNRTSVINSYGFTTGVYNNVTVGGTPQVGISDTASFGQKNVDSLNPLNGLVDDTEGFNVAGGWGLTFSYLFNGTLTAGGPSFSGGDIIFSYFDAATSTSQEVLRVNVTSSALNLANLDLFGLISFDFDNNGSNDCTTAFCQAFWNFQTGSENWYDLNGQGVEIQFHLDTNVNPPFPVASQLTAGSDPQNAYWARQTTLDSSVRFIDVPEPGSLALVGIALVGLAGGGAARRLRKS